MKLPQSGDLFQHYKGDIYKVLCLSDCTTTGKCSVVYVPFGKGANDACHRELGEFLGTVENPHYYEPPDPREKIRPKKYIRRFEYIRNEPWPISLSG